MKITSNKGKFTFSQVNYDEISLIYHSLDGSWASQKIKEKIYLALYESLDPTEVGDREEFLGNLKIYP